MRILVTAGPTREYFDSVRFISNASSGKMGYAIATQAARRGHRVVLVSGPVELPKPDGLDVIHVVSAREMFDVVTSLFPECHAVVLNGIDNVGGELAEVEILRADSGWSPPFSGPKKRIAAAVVDLVESLAGKEQ